MLEGSAGRRLILPCSRLPYPTLSYYPFLPYPTLPYPYPTLPCSTLPYPTRPYPIPTLPYPARTGAHGGVSKRASGKIRAQARGMMMRQSISISISRAKRFSFEA